MYHQIILLLLLSIHTYSEHHVNYYPPTELAISDDEIVNRAVNELHNIDAANDLNECMTCKTRLQVAKFIALTRPDLVPQIFSTWCVESGYDEIQCHMNYGYPSEDYCTMGNDFTKVVSLMNPSGLDGDYFCYYHDKNCHILPETPLVDMSGLWPPKPKNYLPPDNSGETFHVLHLSDINLQPDYKMFSEANCTQSLCCSPHCRNMVKPAPGIMEENTNLDSGFYDSSYSKNHFEKGSYMDITKIRKPTWIPARQFGEYTCDTPALLLNSTMQCIRDLHQNHLSFEFALFTGGTVDHSDRSFMSKHKNIKSQETSYRILKHYLDTVDVIPTFGTRDIFPMNQLPQKNLTENSNSYQWQFDFLADLWSELGWIDHDVSKQIRYSQIGYSLITTRNLKIISLNSNVWNVKNLYAFWDVLTIDSYGIWNFLIEELIDCERNHQRAWIIAHLPTNHQSLPLPTKVFAQIIERFSPKVIAAIFFGHVQVDTFLIQYGGDGTNTKELENAINHALVGPSISPYSGVNPAWRYYAIDSQSFSIVNSFTYYTKLESTFHNDGAEPNWEFGYSTRDVYDPEQMWPMEWCLNTEWWHHVSEKIKEVPEMDLLYQRLETRWFSSARLDEDSYCKVTSFTMEARKQCMVTDDQDDYVEPKQPNDYVPFIHVGIDVEYIDKQIAYPENENENDFVDDIVVEEDEEVIPEKNSSLKISDTITRITKQQQQPQGKSLGLKIRNRNQVPIAQL
ncbi:asm-2 Sphingomyelin phosphodiesterase 2 [Candida maltosa Xu316]